MSEHTTLYTLLAVLAILLAVLFYNNSRARQETPEPATDEDEGGLEDKWLLKFVHHDGNVVGETVARDGDRLILKQAGVFKAVPMDRAEVKGEEVVLEGEIDWDVAIADGTHWHETNTKGHDPLVTEQLTRSEDVRSPALDAMKDRDAEE